MMAACTHFCYGPLQIKSRGYEPVVVLSQADRECAECKTNTLGDFPALNDLKLKVSVILLVRMTCTWCHGSWHVTRHAHAAVSSTYNQFLTCISSVEEGT